jgi:hypothetical protein
MKTEEEVLEQVEEIAGELGDGCCLIFVGIVVMILFGCLFWLKLQK